MAKENMFNQFRNRVADFIKAKPQEPDQVLTKKAPTVPAGSSVRTQDQKNPYEYLDGKEVLKPFYDLNAIPQIRNLVKVNADVGQAHNDMIQLLNTGITIKFDPSVPEPQQDKMRFYIQEQSRLWADGVAGLHGLINKMFSQLVIGGAISNEWVPSRTRNSISNVVFLNPENVRWVRSRGRYKPYQYLEKSLLNNLGRDFSKMNLNKLNPYTYKYFALNGDTDVPYGFPLYLTVFNPVATQGFMIDNIKFITEMVGLLGHLDVRMEKPDMQADESEAVYIQRLNKTLDDLKLQTQQGLRDGISVGYKDDHEFEFSSTTKSASNLNDVFNLNEQQVASALKWDGAFMGRDFGANETSITILFTKIIAQLTNMQSIVEYNLEYGFTLALTMAGFNFKWLDVEFNKTTVTDNLKYQQAEEIKQRVARVLYADGIISQKEHARIMGYKSPDQKEPRVEIDPAKQEKEVIDKKDRKDDKGESEKKTRDKKNPQGTIKKQN